MPEAEPTAQTVADIVARASRGEAEAWSALVRLYARRLYALVRSRLLDRHRSEEIVQDVFAAVYRSLK